MWVGCLKGVGRLYGGCGDAVWWVCKAIWSVRGGCGEGVQKLSGVWGGFLGDKGGCLIGVRRLSGVW